MIADANFPPNLQDEALRTATYCLNRSLTVALVGEKVPSELWFGTKPTVRNLRIFGCTAYVHVPKKLRKI